MLTIGFPAVVAGTNCYVLAPAPGEEGLIVDPGVGFKKHPSNYYTHRSIDAALALRKRNTWTRP